MSLSENAEMLFLVESATRPPRTVAYLRKDAHPGRITFYVSSFTSAFCIAIVFEFITIGYVGKTYRQQILFRSRSWRPVISEIVISTTLQFLTLSSEISGASWR